MVVFGYLMKDCSEGRDSVFLQICSERTRAKKDTSCPKENPIGKFVIITVLKLWNRLLHPCGDSRLGLKNALVSRPTLRGMLVQMTWKSPFQPTLLYSDSMKQSSCNCFY